MEISLLHVNSPSYIFSGSTKCFSEQYLAQAAAGQF